MCHNEVNGERHVVPNVTQHSRCTRNAVVSGGEAGRVLGRMRSGACSPFRFTAHEHKSNFKCECAHLAQRDHTRRSRSSLEPASALPVLARPRPLLRPATAHLGRGLGRPFLHTRSTVFSGGSGGSCSASARAAHTPEPTRVRGLPAPLCVPSSVAPPRPHKELNLPCTPHPVS